MTYDWTHTPETGQHGEAWRIRQGGITIALVASHAPSTYTACVYMDGSNQDVGNIYRTAGSAKAACVRQLRERGVIQ